MPLLVASLTMTWIDDDAVVISIREVHAAVITTYFADAAQQPELHNQSTRWNQVWYGILEFNVPPRWNEQRSLQSSRSAVIWHCWLGDMKGFQPVKYHQRFFFGRLWGGGARPNLELPLEKQAVK